MNNRVLSLVGAGAVLDFDFGENIVVPTTQNITEELKRIQVQYKNGKQIKLNEKIYDCATNAIEQCFNKMNIDNAKFNNPINFETIVYLLESLHSFSLSWEQSVYPNSYMASFVKPLWQENDSYLYYDYLKKSVRTIIDIVHKYDDRYKNKQIVEPWYEKFWKGFESNLDVFTLNYDNTIENSIGENEYEDGFVGSLIYKRFEPEILWYNTRNLPTICHLHGSILFGNVLAKPYCQTYNPKDLYKFFTYKDSNFEERFFPKDQANEYFQYVPIITGLHKTEKLTYMPYSFYHAFLTKKILENSSLLIVGYSFGDIYVNQLIERHRLIHGNNQRVIVVDYISSCDGVKELWERIQKEKTVYFRDFLYFFIGNTDILSNSTFEQDFMQNIKKSDKDGDYWESKDGTLRLYLKGFKHMVVNHKEDVMKYLQD